MDRRSPAPPPAPGDLWDGPDWAGVDVLVVVVTYRGGPSLARCLGALAAQRPGDADAPLPRHHLLVVDNGGTPATRGVLAAVAGRDDVDVVAPGRNLGFAAGADVGLEPAARAAREGRWPDGLVVLVNDDAVPRPDFLARMWAAHRAAPADVAALTGLMLLAGRGATGSTGPGGAGGTGGPGGTVNSTGTLLRSRGSAEDRDYGRALADLPAGGAPAEVFGFCGGAAGLRAAALARVGVLDPAWFLYYEDVDLSWRMRAAGLRVLHVPGAVVEHELAASSGTESPVFRFHNDRNALLTFTRHAPAAVAWRAWLRFPAAVAWHAARPATRPLVPVRLRALRAALVLLPRTLAERRRLWPEPGRRREVAKRWLDRDR